MITKKGFIKIPFFLSFFFLNLVLIMIGCIIFYYSDGKIAANHFHSNEKTFNLWEGEVMIYDVRALAHRNLLNKFRGFNTDYIAKYIEYFRSVDGFDEELRHHAEIFRKINRKIGYERRTFRKRSNVG